MGQNDSSIAERVAAIFSALSDTYDLYGWIALAIVLTILLFAFYIFLCWAFEDIVTEFPLIRGPRFIFVWTRKWWKNEAMIKP